MGAKVPGNENSRERKFHGAKVLGTFTPEERKFHGCESSMERKFLDFSLHGSECSRERKFHGNESSMGSKVGHYPTLAPPGGLTLHIEKLLNSSFSINLLCLKDLAHFSYIYPTKEPSLNR